MQQTEYAPQKYASIKRLRQWKRNPNTVRTRDPLALRSLRARLADGVVSQPRTRIRWPRFSCRWTAQLAGLVVFGLESRHGAVEYTHADFMALAGCSRGSAQNALREAERLQLVEVVYRFMPVEKAPAAFLQRCRPGQKHVELAPFLVAGPALVALMRTARSSAERAHLQRQAERAAGQERRRQQRADQQRRRAAAAAERERRRVDSARQADEWLARKRKELRTDASLYTSDNVHCDRPPTVKRAAPAANFGILAPAGVPPAEELLRSASSQAFLISPRARVPVEVPAAPASIDKRASDEHSAVGEHAANAPPTDAPSAQLSGLGLLLEFGRRL